jgi:sugar lactone lactonase YvrE
MNTLSIAIRERTVRTVLIVVLLLAIPSLGNAQTDFQREVVFAYSGTSYSELPFGIAIDQEGNYIVGEAGSTSDGSSKIARIDPDNGTRTILWESPIDPTPGTGYQIYDLEIAANGDFIVAESWNRTIARITLESGVYQRYLIYEFPASPASLSVWPMGIGIDTVNAVYLGHYLVPFADPSSYQGVARITPDGATQQVLYGVSDNLRGPYDVAVDPAGFYIIPESANSYGGGAGVLVRVNPSDGTRKEIYQFDPGTFPMGVAIDEDGSYLVTEYDKNCLSRIYFDGTAYQRELVYQFDAGTKPARVAVDVDGTYLVTEHLGFLSRISPISPETPGRICSVLGNDPKPSLLDQDIFEFQGRAGDSIAVTLDKDLSGTTSGDRVSLILIQKGRLSILKLDRSDLPNQVALTLPRAGTYQVIVAEEPKILRGKQFRGNYCLSLEASPSDVVDTFEPTAWVE